MADILCLESATDVCSVAIARDGEPLMEYTLADDRRHSSQLLPCIDKCLANAGLSINQIDAVAVSAGPGSYTGLRVGASSAKGICFASDIPLISISSLRAIAEPFVNDAAVYNVIIPTIDARRMEVYLSIQSSLGEELQPTYNLIWSDESIANLVQEYGKILICGNGVEKLSNDVEVPSSIIRTASLANATNLCGIAQAKFDKQDFEDVAYFAPHYYKSPNITTPKKIF